LRVCTHTEVETEKKCITKTYGLSNAPKMGVSGYRIGALIILLVDVTV